MPNPNPLEPYWEEVPDNTDYKIQWTVPDDRDMSWYAYGNITDATEQRAIEFLRQVREDKKKSGAKFRLIKTTHKIYHDGGF